MLRNDGKRLLPVKEALLDVFHEPVGAVLVGDVHVENGKAEAGIIVKHFGHGDVDDLARAGGALVLVFLDAGKLEAFAVVAEADAVPGQVLPHRAGLGIILRDQRAVGAHRVAAAGRGAVLFERPADGVGHLHEVVRLHADQPAVAHARGLRLHVEVVADGELPREGVVIHHDGHILERRLALFLGSSGAVPTAAGWDRASRRECGRKWYRRCGSPW